MVGGTWRVIFWGKWNELVLLGVRHTKLGVGGDTTTAGGMESGCASAAAAAEEEEEAVVVMVMVMVVVESWGKSGQTACGLISISDRSSSVVDGRWCVCVCVCEDGGR